MNHPIQFLTDRLSIPDNICYNLISFIPPNFIFVENSVATNFINAYKKWAQNRCSFCFRIINVSKLSPNLPKVQDQQQQSFTSFYQPLSQILNQAGIQYQYYTPSDPSQADKFFRCNCTVINPGVEPNNPSTTTSIFETPRVS